MRAHLPTLPIAITALCTAIILAWSPASAIPAAAEYRVATVDILRIMNESTKAKARRKEIDALANKARAEIEKRRTALKATEEKLKRSGAKEDSKEVAEFRKDAKELARLVKDSEEELKREFLNSNRELTEEAMEVIKNYAKRNKIDLVLDSSEATKGLVLYGAGGLDITDQVVKELNRG